MSEQIEKDKIYNCDCLEGMKHIPNASIDAIICDLPYGTTACAWDVVIPFDQLWEQYKRIIKPRGAIVLFGSQPFTSAIVSSNVSMFGYEIIWEKEQATNPMFAKYGVLKSHENILVFYKQAATYNPQMEYGHSNYKSFKGDKGVGQVWKDNLRSEHRDCTDGSRFPKSVLRFARDADAFHPTQKPVDLLRYLIRTYSNEGDTILDNCMGSGTTAVACIKEKRHFIGFELNKDYYDKACRRIDAERRQLSLF